MPKIINHDSELRNTFSFWFRIIIILFAIYLLYYSNNNTWPWGVYLAGSVVYFVLFFYLKRKEYSIARLLNDFAYILFIIYGKDFHNPVALIFILLPLINSPNHSGKSSSPVTLTILSFALLIYLIRDSDYFKSEDINFIIYLIVPIVLILGIVLVEVYRSHKLRLKEQFHFKIENYYANTLKSIQKPYEILRDIVGIINDERISVFSIQLLMCFRIKEDRITLFRGSKFIFHYKLLNKESILEKLRTEGVAINESIEVEGNTYPHTIWYLIEANNAEYLYVLINDVFTPNHYRYLLQSMFARLTSILVLEDFLIDQKNRYLEKLKNKIEFMDDAQMSMHFIKNKLGPISNFVEICKDFENEVPDRNTWTEHIVKEGRKAIINIPLIIEKAETFHKNVEGIFSFTEYEQVPISKLVELLRSSWSAYFSDEDIEIQIKIEEVSAFTVEINDDLLEILFNNWISNMSKYHFNDYSLTISENRQSVIVVFRNNVSSNQIAKAIAFAHDFNSDERGEILKRSSISQGLRELRYLAKELELHTTIAVNENIIKFMILFPKI
jgi:hypothetical protein